MFEDRLSGLVPVHWLHRTKGTSTDFSNDWHQPNVYALKNIQRLCVLTVSLQTQYDESFESK